MKTFQQFMEQIGSVEPNEYSKQWDKANMIAKRRQTAHAHDEMQQTAARQQREKLNRTKEIQNR